MNTKAAHTRCFTYYERPAFILATVCFLVYLPLAMVQSGHGPTPWWALALASWALQGLCVRWIWRYLLARESRRLAQRES